MQNKLLFILLLFSVLATAQTRKLDSLKSRLPLLADNKKVDCLNKVAREFTYKYIRVDSGMKYADLAYALATNSHYVAGEALAILTIGDIQGRLSGNTSVMINNSRRAIDLLSDEKDRSLLSFAYYNLAIALNMQDDHEQALDEALVAKQIATAANDRLRRGWAIQAAGLIYCHMGEYWKSFSNMIESQQIGKDEHDSLLTAISLAIIGRCFNRVDDPRQALNYYYESLPYMTPFCLLWPHLEDMAFAHLQLKQYDSVLYYQQKHRSTLFANVVDKQVLKKFTAYFWGNSVEVQLARKQFDDIISEETARLPALRAGTDTYVLMQALLVLGKAYRAKLAPVTSLGYARELLAVSGRLANKPYLKDGNQLMAEIFDDLHRPDSAYKYYKNYIALQHEIESSKFTQRTALYAAASEAENKIRLLKKDQQISAQQLILNQKELTKQGRLRDTLLISLLVLTLISVLVIRNNILKRRNEQLRNDQDQLALKRKALELEMQALRAQMNPHFIFNCLSAIDNLMQTNQAEKATSYLGRFANLIRGVLESSKNNLVPFQKDFATLKLYLEMEQFRCNNKFHYSLNADRELLEGDYKVPPLIIQPFVENAIHHGLLNKQDSNRMLNVSVKLHDERIIYSVTDNGVGRTRAGILKKLNRPEHQSYGIAITRERIQLHNGNGLPQDVLITDLEHGGMAVGTSAIVKINSFEF